MPHPFADTPQYRQQREAEYEHGHHSRPSLTWLAADSGQSFAFDNEGELVPVCADTYFADTDDEHATFDRADEYDGPSIDEMQDAFDALTLKQQFVLSRRLGLAGDHIQYTQAEISEAMGLTVREVKLLEERARRSLRANVVGLDARLAA